jgi:hypothetical protein
MVTRRWRAPFFYEVIVTDRNILFLVRDKKRSMKKLSMATTLTLLLFSSSHAQKMDALSDAEKADGWQLLFDGKTLTRWHSNGKTGPDGIWGVQNGLLHGKGGGDFSQGQEDLVVDSAHGEFDLRLV